MDFCLECSVKLNEENTFFYEDLNVQICKLCWNSSNFGFKGFNCNWTCKGYYFGSPSKENIHELKNDPIAGKYAFHYCTNIVQTFKYYNPNTETCKFAVIKDIGKSDFSLYWKKNIICSNKIQIVQEININDFIFTLRSSNSNNLHKKLL